MNKGLIRWTVIGLLVIAILTPSACKAPAKFEVSSLVIRPAEVVAGEVVTVKADVTNIGGSEGVYTATLKVNGVETGTRDIVLDAGARQAATFSLVKDIVGTYNIEIDGLTGTLRVLKPTEFRISNVVIMPSEPSVGETVELQADVANVGDVEGSHTVTLLVDGTEVERKGITLAPGSMQTVSFELVRDVAGAYKVQIDGVSETLVVREVRTEKLGEVKYDIEHEVTLKNEGPGVASRVKLRIALITTREPYQTVVSTEIKPDSYKTTEDEYGNTFAEFEFSDMGAGEEIPVKITYHVAVSQLRYHLGRGEGPVPARFLEPEQWIESDAEEIVALAEQLTKDKLSPGEKARAIYDWIGDNISYTGYCGEDRGALFALRNGGGDCTEFSYLLIALCRAAGIPARFLQGVNPKSPSPAAEKHDWAEVYLVGTGWVPVDPTWGRFKEKREQYFACMSSDHIIVTTGNPALMGKWCTAFHSFEYRWWWAAEKAELSRVENWQIRRAD